MKRHLVATMLAGFALISYSAPMLHAEDLDVKIDRMKIKEDKDDIAEGRMNITKWEQIVNERRALRDKAKSDYEMNMAKSAKSKLTKESKDRYDSAERSVRRAEKKLTKAQESLHEDEAELNAAYDSLSKSKKD